MFHNHKYIYVNVCTCPCMENWILMIIAIARVLLSSRTAALISVRQSMYDETKSPGDCCNN